MEREGVWLAADGRRLTVAWSVRPLGLVHGRDTYLVCGVDVTEQKRQQEEIRRSRARIVEAESAERRRLERNLHDGAQQRLVSLSLALRLAQARLGTDPEAAREIIGAAAAELALALEELRELARGLHPAILSDRGLAAALEALAQRAPLPVELEALPARPLPAPVEAGIFYVVSESLTNVAKYAAASHVRVRITCEAGTRSSRSWTTASAAPTPRAGPASAGSSTASRRSTAGSWSRARPARARASARSCRSPSRSRPPRCGWPHLATQASRRPGHLPAASPRRQAGARLLA